MWKLTPIAVVKNAEIESSNLSRKLHRKCSNNMYMNTLKLSFFVNVFKVVFIFLNRVYSLSIKKYQSTKSSMYLKNGTL